MRQARTTKLAKAAIFALVFFLGSVSAAQSTTVGVEFAGTFVEVSPALSSVFTVGGGFSGVLRYPLPGPPPGFVSGGGGVVYEGAVSTLSVTTSGYSALGTNGAILIEDDFCGFCIESSDTFSVLNSFNAPPVGPNVGDFALDLLFVSFQAFSFGAVGALQGLDLPAALPSLQAWDETRVLVGFFDGTSSVFARGVITSLRRIPAPTPFTAILLGLAVALTARRLRNRRATRTPHHY